MTLDGWIPVFFLCLEFFGSNGPAGPLGRWVAGLGCVGVRVRVSVFGLSILFVFVVVSLWPFGNFIMVHKVNDSGSLSANPPKSKYTQD